MTRIIKPSEILPGMTIRWRQGGLSYQCKLASVKRIKDAGDMQVETPQGRAVLIFGDTDVLVVEEPPQPEEPTEFGARVVVNGRRFIQAPAWKFDDQPWLEEGKGKWVGWDELCSLGPVTVIPDQGWTVPADAPEVPERIEEWPEDDTALRPHKWREHCGYTWMWVATASEWECYDEVGNYVASGWRPSCGPWDRVADA